MESVSLGVYTPSYKDRNTQHCATISQMVDPCHSLGHPVLF
jgi:hypothetical protein